MFLRKLTVMAVPPMLLAAVCVFMPLTEGLGFWTPVLQGAVPGFALALLLPLSGAVRKKEPFAALLWIPVLLVLALIVCQYLTAAGTQIPLPDQLMFPDDRTVRLECLFMTYMLTNCIRTL